MAKKKKNLKQSNISNAQRRKNAQKRQKDAAAARGQSTMSRNKANLIVIAVVVVALISAVVALVTSITSDGEQQYTAVIHDSDNKTSRIEMTESAVQDFTTDKGHNVVRVEDGQVTITESSCADQACVLAGPISEEGQQLVCEENQFYVEIVKKGEEAHEMNVDAMPKPAESSEAAE
jgi:hypothetical protein